MLLMICKSSALRVVMSVDKGEGAEAWRKLVARYEPRTQQRQATQMVALLNVDLSGDLEDKTLNWERQIAVYEEQSKKVFADDLRIGAWLRAAPESAVKTHMLMKTDLVRWADWRAEMMRITRAIKASHVGVNPVPMDLSALGKAKDGKPKGHGKDKGGKTKDPKGGKPKGAWDKGGKGSKGKDSKGNKGKDGKGYGGWSNPHTPRAHGGGSSSSSSASTSSAKTCWKCGQKGHLSSQCPNKRSGLQAIEDGNPNEIASLDLGVTSEVQAYWDNLMLGCLSSCRGSFAAASDDYYQDMTVKYITIDTGAVRTVFPLGWALDDVPILPTKSSKRGDFYWGAGAEKIYDLGGQVLTLDVEDLEVPLILRGAVCKVPASVP